MGTERIRANTRNEGLDKLSAPPGFVSRTSFLLKKVQISEESCKSVAFVKESSQEPGCTNALSDMVDARTLKGSLSNRPWILYQQSDNNQKESDSQQPVEELSSKTSLPKGVTRGCPECSHCLKVTARWCPEGAKRDIYEEAPVFYPNEEEFSDTLKYIASIRLKSEEYGICRIVPPPSWNPPCLIKEKDVWETSKLITQIQQIDGLQKTATICENVNRKRRRSLLTGLHNRMGNRCTINPDGWTDDFESEPHPEFTLETFKNYADDFKDQYFCTNNMVTNVDKNPVVFQKQTDPSLENIEGEYRRIVENPTDEIEVLHGENLVSGTFSSGFPSVSNPSKTSDHERYLKSGWNLINLPMLPGSLLSFESCKTSNLLAPRLHVGMCFTSISWKVEEHHLYSLHYMHLGEPKIWHGIPWRYLDKFNVATRKYLPDLSLTQSKSPSRRVASMSPSTLKSEGVPVYRCSQSPGEFVLIFPGACSSGFDCGFNFSESVNFAPIDWLPHGQNAIEIYREQGRKTSISHDKLLLGAAREAVKAQWEISLVKKCNSDNSKWKDVCGKNGVLAKALKSRIKSESNGRKYLCPSTKSNRMDKRFNETSKRECHICLSDLHLSAVYCSCSPNIYSCLHHVKQLCSCAWTEKILLFRYEISELNVLLEALEGKLSAVYRWAKTDLKLYLHSYSSSDGLRPNSQAEELKHTVHKPLDSATSNGTGSTLSSIRAKMKARLLQTKSSNSHAEESKQTADKPLDSAPSNGIESITFPSIGEKTKACLRQAESTNGPVKATASNGVGKGSAEQDVMQSAKDETQPKVVLMGTTENSSFLIKEIAMEGFSDSDSSSVSSSSESK